MIISLSGFMGCGKSSVGRELSARLGLPLIDLDSYIEKESGRTIPEIFAEDGEAPFREMEYGALRAILAPTARPVPEVKPEAILSLGGGTLTTPQCADLVRDFTLNFYLRANLRTLVDNLAHDYSGRPMLGGNGNPLDEEALGKRIAGLMTQRSAVYESTAHHIIDIEGKTFSDIASCIAHIITPH